MVRSPRWRATLTLFHLRSEYLGATDFYQLVRQEQVRIAKAESTVGAQPNLRLLSKLWAHRLEWMLALASGIAALLLALRWQKLTARHREESLRQALQELSQEVERRSREALQRVQDMAAVRVGMNAQIEREFDRWGLTSAERSVAHLTLKGLRLKDIARARNTSDRTVRQQAQAIYRKAGLDGRTDLSAYFSRACLAGRSSFRRRSIPHERRQSAVAGDTGPGFCQDEWCYVQEQPTAHTPRRDRPQTARNATRRHRQLTVGCRPNTSTFELFPSRGHARNICLAGAECGQSRGPACATFPNICTFGFWSPS